MYTRSQRREFMNREEVEEEVEVEEEDDDNDYGQENGVGEKEHRKEEPAPRSSKRCPVRPFVVCRLARQLAGVNRRNYIEEKLPRDNSD